MGITHIENGIFTSAKKGHLKYITEPFEGCDFYFDNHHNLPFDKEGCDIIVNNIKTIIFDRFPDCDITYDDITKQYTFTWY